MEYRVIAQESSIPEASQAKIILKNNKYAYDCMLKEEYDKNYKRCAESFKDNLDKAIKDNKNWFVMFERDLEIKSKWGKNKDIIHKNCINFIKTKIFGITISEAVLTLSKYSKYKIDFIKYICDLGYTVLIFKKDVNDFRATIEIHW